VAPPDPIPNSEVKRVSADNTNFARYWEDRSRLGDREAVNPPKRTFVRQLADECERRRMMGDCENAGAMNLRK